MPIPNSWRSFLPTATTQLLEQTEAQLLQMRTQTPAIYPEQHLLFHALELTPPQNVKVVLLGQDPYHTRGAAHGLAFSIRQGYPIQPSLHNIFQKLQDDYPNQPCPTTTDLSYWAQQGVLLLNTSLSVEEGKPGRHAQLLPWQTGIISVLQTLNQTNQPLAFLLWGKHAQTVAAKAGVRPADNRFIMVSSHPSPLSATRSTASYPAFFNTHPFRDVNRWLLKQNASPIDWNLK